jgi:hypothetical protein
MYGHLGKFLLLQHLGTLDRAIAATVVDRPIPSSRTPDPGLRNR